MSLMLSIAEKVGDLVLEKIDSTASRKIRKFLTGDLEKKALMRSVHAGVLCMLQAWEGQDHDDAKNLERVLTKFFEEPDVARALLELLTGTDWSEDELYEIFQDASKDAPMANLDFRAGLGVFKAAFLANAVTEERLQELIGTGNILEQTRVLKAIQKELNRLPELIEAIEKSLKGIEAGEINAHNVVSGVQLIIQQIQDPGIPEDKLEEVYLNAFCTQCDALDLSITDDKYTHDGDHAVSLSQVFTRLYLDGLTRHEGEPVADVIKNERKQTDVSPDKSGREKQTLPITALEAINAVDRLAITGQPGGGKSTLVNYLFVQLARARLQGQTVEGWTGPLLLPVRIILRRFAQWIPDDTTTGQAGQIWDYLAHMIAEKKGRAGAEDVFDYVCKTLTLEGGIVFFDGLDEVGYGEEVSKRDIIKQAVVDFASQLKTGKIVITSRPYAYRDTDTWRLPESDYPVVDLALFNKDQVKAFARNWYQTVGKAVKGWDEARCTTMTRDFVHAVDTREGLFAIVTNPLLLTMAVQLHSRDNFLPHKRADLYQKVIELLLARWENNIVRDIEDWDLEQVGDAIPRLKLSMKKMLAALARIAFNSHCQQLESGGSRSETADIARGDLLVELEHDFESELAGKIIEYIQYRAGILQGKDNRTFSFMHRTFQEYLAARHILELEDYDTQICQRLEHDLDWWQEVFLLMAGGAETRRAATIRDLVESLLEDKQTITDFTEEGDFKQLLLAAQTLWETNYLDECVGMHKDTKSPYQNVFTRVHTCLQHGLTAEDQLLASQRVLAGHWLSRLGDPRPEVLHSARMAFCEIPQRDFWLGDGKDNDCPHELCKALNYDYWLSKYPITVSQFRQFADAGGYQQEQYWPEAMQAEFWKDGQVKFWQDEDCRADMPDLPNRFDYKNHPMVLVSWFEGLAYCRWLTELFHKGEMTSKELEGLDRQAWYVTLPSEAEWEKAARGSERERVYPCGDKLTANLANYSETGIDATSAVGCFPRDKSPYGCFDMTGNVWEWCRNAYESYPYKCDDRERVDKNIASGRVIRGGSWGIPAESCRCSYRNGADPDSRGSILGFRVVLVPSSLSSGR